METQERLDLFMELMQCKYDLWLWSYSTEQELLGTSCPDERFWSLLFQRGGFFAHLFDHFAKSDRPLLLDSALGVVWGAATDGERIFVLGPVMSTEGNVQDLNQVMEELIRGVRREAGEDMSLRFSYELASALRGLPVVSAVGFMDDLCMLHCALSGENVRRWEIAFENLSKRVAGDEAAPEPRRRNRDRHQTWMAEQALLGKVRNGDLDYASALNRAGNVSDGVPLKGRLPIQKARFSCVTFTALCTRAAIEGGLTPELAYTVGDRYLQEIENCRTAAEAMSVNHAMLDDFVHRVHAARTDPRLSPQIQACCDYVELHVEDDLSLELLASNVGYTPYYLSRRFKAETGVNIKAFINAARVERAKELLATSDTPVSQIGERLHFCSRSYFADVFQKAAGMTPQEWRRREQKY